MIENHDGGPVNNIGICLFGHEAPIPGEAQLFKIMHKAYMNPDFCDSARHVSMSAAVRA
jgi:hypothetical protein